MDQKMLLSKIRDKLRAVYRDRLEGIVLYGSVARMDEREDSDIDVLVLLSPPLDYGKELEVMIRTLFPLSLEWGREISPKPALKSDFEEGDYPLYQAARREGVVL